jgi:predicted permease
VPGVQAVATVDTVPMREGNNQLGYWTSAALPPRSEQPLALATSVTPEYLDVMRLPLRQGRFFDEHDRLGAEPVVVIDEVLAKHAFGDEGAVGRRLWIPDMGRDPVRVIGVVPHVRHWGLAGDDSARVRAQLYYPFAQVPDPLLRRWSELMSIAVRSSVGPLTIVDQLRNEIRGAANDQVLYEVRTMEQLANGSLSQHRFLLQLFAIFAAVALLLASVGLYGVLSYLVGRRKSEMGVRMALGASATDVVWLVLKESLVMVAAGFVVGICAGLAGVRLLDMLITGMRPPDVQTFVAVSTILGVAALSASVLPAWRATRVDPIVALRTE